MKKLLSALLLAALLLSLSALALADGTAYPLTLKDHAGREVVIEDKPERLVSGYYISTSAVIALGLEDTLVGVEAKANKRPIYALSAPELIALPNVGTAKEFDLEGCAALNPDLVILPLKLKSAADTLTSLGVDVLLVNPENQTQLNEMIVMIGAAMDAGERAQALLDFTAAQEASLTALFENCERPRVYLAGNSSLLSTAGSAMYQSDMIRLAGGENVAAAITDNYWMEISYEQLLAWNPEVILLASDASYTVEDVLSDKNLEGCDAIANGRVYQMPGDAEAWDSPVPSGILGAVWFAGMLHPDLMAQEKSSALINEFYETYYGFSYNAN